jgi:hypothetical protein
MQTIIGAVYLSATWTKVQLAIEGRGVFLILGCSYNSIGCDLNWLFYLEDTSIIIK